MCLREDVQHGLAGKTGHSQLEGGDGEASAAGVGSSGCRCSWHNQDPWWSETKGYKKVTPI